MDIIEDEFGGHRPNDMFRHYHFLPRPEDWVADAEGRNLTATGESTDAKALRAFLCSSEAQESGVRGGLGKAGAAHTVVARAARGPLPHRVPSASIPLAS